MKQVLLVLAALASIAPLAGCVSPRQQTFSCSASDGSRGDVMWMGPATKDAAGYYTCNPARG